MIETIKPIEGYEERYSVSSIGRIWDSKQQKWLYGADTSRNRMYKVVALYKDGACKHFYIHRLVAQAFIPNPDNLPMVNHKDENGHHNNVDNLEWCDAKYNSNYGTAIERSRQHYRETINRRKAQKPPQYYTHAVNQVDINGEIVATYKNYAEAAREMGCTRQNLQQAVEMKRIACGYYWHKNNNYEKVR